MLKENNRLVARVHFLFDLLLTTGAFIAAYFIKKYLMPGGMGGLSKAPNYYLLLAMVVGIWGVSFQMFNLYASFRKNRLSRILLRTVQSVLFSLLILSFAMYALKVPHVSRGMMLLFGGVNAALLCLSKAGTYHLLRAIRSRGINTRNVLLVGTRGRARDIMTRLTENIGAGYRVQGCLDVDPALVGQVVFGDVKVVGTVEDLTEVLKETVVDELIFAMPLKLIPDVSTSLALAEEMGVGVRIVPDWQIQNLIYKPAIATIGFETFLEIPTLKLHMISPNEVGLMLKHAADYLLSCVALVLTAPLFLAVAVAIKAISPGPVFYRQKRMGMNGRFFEMIKFRTMVVGADAMLDALRSRNEADGPAFKIRNDPRVIPYVGTFLRRTSLDELPQLINVVRGEMSLIGPRPPIPSEVREYEIWQRRRLSMKPGMTCIWQVTPNRNDVSFDGWMKMDLEYIDNWSLGMDAKILLSTIRAVIMGSGR